MNVSKFFSSVVASGLLVSGLSSCGSNPGGEATAETPAPLTIAVSVPQWSELAVNVAGDCAKVVPVLGDASVDPHEFEPTPADIQALTTADFQLVNGDGYDQWAVDALDQSTGTSLVIDDIAQSVLGESLTNPHFWFSQSVDEQAALVLSEKLTTLAAERGETTDCFNKNADKYVSFFENALYGFDSSAIAGQSFAATESVVDYLALSLGLTDKTPTGFAQAITNEAEPTPSDLEAFNRLLDEKQVNFLIFNDQEQTDLDLALLAKATENGIAVVHVTETRPLNQGSDSAWLRSIISQFFTK